MDLTARARRVRLAIFDVDGVMTDGTIYIGARGEAFKAFNIHDGHGLKMLRDAGVVTAILSGRKHGAVHRNHKVRFARAVARHTNRTMSSAVNAAKR